MDPFYGLNPGFPHSLETPHGRREADNVTVDPRRTPLRDAGVIWKLMKARVFLRHLTITEKTGAQMLSCVVAYSYPYVHALPYLR